MSVQDEEKLDAGGKHGQDLRHGIPVIYIKNAPNAPKVNPYH